MVRTSEKYTVWQPLKTVKQDARHTVVASSSPGVRGDVSTRMVPPHTTLVVPEVGATQTGVMKKGTA